MKVLVATRASQGARRGDYDHCVTGELVWMLEPCPASLRNPAGKCGCGRSFEGMSSHRSTTTALVREIPELTRADFAAALRASFDAQGWCPCCCAQPVDEAVDGLIAAAARWPEGAVIERRLNVLSLRAQLPSPRGNAG
ncbi:hypothetical protein [Cryobacterium sp. MLB-32]|uniref:DUF7715 family protein n=1 Tax=Cryobacterium sp. MLB-32 TaxID=1529318 RepID=UPI00068A029A|nr:hypothetical protein [Cryobacterium sp. MLB-32]